MYIHLTQADEPDIADSVDIGDDGGVTADLNDQGDVIGLEILWARKRLGEEGTKCMRLEMLEGEESGSVEASRR